MLHTRMSKTKPFSVQAPSLPLSSAPVSGIGTSSYTAANPENAVFWPKAQSRDSVMGLSLGVTWKVIEVLVFGPHPQRF